MNKRDDHCIFAVAIANAIPFVGFGFLDNFIMIVAVRILWAFAVHYVSIFKIDVSGRSNRVDAEQKVSDLHYGSGSSGQHSIRCHWNRFGALCRDVCSENRLRSAQVNSSTTEST